MVAADEVPPHDDLLAERLAADEQDAAGFAGLQGRPDRPEPRYSSGPAGSGKPSTATVPDRASAAYSQSGFSGSRVPAPAGRTTSAPASGL